MRVHVASYFKSPIISPTTIGLGIFIILAFSALVSLGSWQRQRGHYKQQLLQYRHEAQQQGFLSHSELLQDALENQRYRAVRLTGKLLSDKTFLLDNQSYQGKIGYHVLTPFEMASDELILVNRGWIPAPPSRMTRPDIPIQPGVITIEGYVDKGYVNPLIKSALDSPEISWPLRIQIIDYNLVGQLLGQEVVKKLVVLSKPIDKTITPIPPIGEWLTPERHFAYAFQWYSLAGLLLLLSLMTLWRANKK